VKELEVEISIWKEALTTMRNGQARENRAMTTVADPQKNVQIALCIIDTTRVFFASTFLTEGEEGGRKAGEGLVRGITNYLDGKCIQAKIVVTIYIRKAQLRDDLTTCGVCTPEQFDTFCVGLNETPYLNIVEVTNKRDLEKKIEENLQVFAYYPQTVRVFISGGSGPAIPTLDACKSSGKLVVIRSHASQIYGPYSQIPFVTLTGLLFPSSSFLSTSPFPWGESDECDLRTSSASVYTPTTATSHRQSIVNPTLPLYRQSPPLCNEFYLTQSCSKEDRCWYSHEYDLTDEQLAELAKDVKKFPCRFLNNDTECPQGANCIWGHVCPHGVKCSYTSKDKCWFKGSGMHRPRGDLS